VEPRIRRFSDHLKARFPFRVWKLPVDAGFTCPNRDGTKAWGGCTYCDNRSFSPPARDRSVPLREQMERGLAKQRERGVAKAIVFFQAYTNTYAPVEHLRALWDEALSFPDVAGLAIATRPDCVPDPVLDLVEATARRTAVWLEIGLETSHDATLASLNRAHTFAEYEDAVRRARGRGFELVSHLIFGLPGETREKMFETVDRVAALDVDAVKLHHFYVARGTPLEAAYRRGDVRTASFDEWVSLAADIIERLPRTLYIERVAGELANAWLVAPRWGKSNSAVWSAVERELERRGTTQGSLVASPR
jgi:hypothetical protein